MTVKKMWKQVVSCSYYDYRLARNTSYVRIYLVSSKVTDIEPLHAVAVTMAGIDPNSSGLVDAAKEFVEASELAIIKAQRLRASAERSNLQPPDRSLHVSDGKWTYDRRIKWYAWYN